MQAYQQKTEKFFVSEEKKFGRIDSWLKKFFYITAPVKKMISYYGPTVKEICKFLSFKSISSPGKKVSILQMFYA